MKKNVRKKFCKKIKISGVWDPKKTKEKPYLAYHCLCGNVSVFPETLKIPEFLRFQQNTKSAITFF